MTATVSSAAAADWRARCRRWLSKVFDQPASVRGVAVLRIVLGPSVIWHLRPFLADALRGITYHDRFQQPWWPWYPNAPDGLYVALLWIGVAAAVLMTVGLWSRTATWAAFAVVAFHVGIEVSARVQVFSVIAVGALALWATPSTRDRTLVTPRRWVGWLDWMARFDITVAPGASWYMVDRDGTVLEGREARRFVRTRLPATFLFSRLWRYP